MSPEKVAAVFIGGMAVGLLGWWAVGLVLFFAVTFVIGAWMAR